MPLLCHTVKVSLKNTLNLYQLLVQAAGQDMNLTFDLFVKEKQMISI